MIILIFRKFFYHVRFVKFLQSLFFITRLFFIQYVTLLFKYSIYICSFSLIFTFRLESFDIFSDSVSCNGISFAYDSNITFISFSDFEFCKNIRADILMPIEEKGRRNITLVNNLFIYRSFFLRSIGKKDNDFGNSYYTKCVSKFQSKICSRYNYFFCLRQSLMVNKTNVNLSKWDHATSILVIIICFLKLKCRKYILLFLCVIST